LPGERLPSFVMLPVVVPVPPNVANAPIFTSEVIEPLFVRIPLFKVVVPKVDVPEIVQSSPLKLNASNWLKSSS